MKVIYINPLGEKKEADLTPEMLEKLRKVKGIVVVSPVVKPRISVSDSVCVSCEG
jgi:DNA replicative helicase MCM subunit Mcm2 (Cdc46/Mcm family)